MSGGGGGGLLSRHAGLLGCLATLTVAGWGLPALGAALPARAGGAPPAHGLRLHGSVLYGARLDTGGGGADAEPGSPEQMEPRAGFLALAGLQGGREPARGGSGWRWGLGFRLDSPSVPHLKPYTRGGFSWDPGSVGLKPPGAPSSGRLDEIWTEYGVGAFHPEAPVAGSADPADGGWAVWVGRRRLWMGAGTPLTSGAQAPGVDQAGGGWRSGQFAYHKVVGRLEPGGDRYVLLQQLSLGPWDVWQGRLTLVGYELGVVSGRFVSVGYNWLPFWPGYLTQHWKLGGVGNDDSNFYFGAGARWWRPFGWAADLDAELLVDDMPQNVFQPGQPFQLGGTVGVRFPVHGRRGRPEQGGFELRYTRVNNFVITFQRDDLSLVHGGRLLAYPDGPDGDALRVEWWPDSPRLSRQVGGTEWGITALGLEWRRRGSGRVGDIWERQPDREQVRGQEFLAGPVVEHALLLHLTLSRSDPEVAPSAPGRNPVPSLRLTLGPVWNAANREGRTGFFLQLTVRVL